jgi:hypothetical protein
MEPKIETARKAQNFTLDVHFGQPLPFDYHVDILSVSETEFLNFNHLK